MSKHENALASELPEYSRKIQTLRSSNMRFARIMDVYQDTADTVRRIQAKDKESLNEYEDELAHRCAQLKMQLMHMILDERQRSR